MRILVLGASGGVGRRVVERGLARGLKVRAQTRTAARLADLAGAVEVVEADPLDAAAVQEILRDVDAVVYALGIGHRGKTTFFSETTRILLAAMAASGVRRLVAVTGVGAGETRGHGGAFYDRVVFPLFTRNLYDDKERQEALIEASGLDWVVVRPAPFANRPATGRLQVHTRIAPDLVLRRVGRDEVAAFVLDQLTSDAYLRRKPFIGHP